MAGAAEPAENRRVSGGEGRNRGAGRGRAVAGLLLGWVVLVPMASAGVLPEDQIEAPPPKPIAAPARPNAEGEAVANAEPVPVSEDPDPRASRPGWLNDRRIMVEHRVGALIANFDRFFGDGRLMDVEEPSSRFRFKSFVRTSRDRDFAWGGAVNAAVNLPRLERWLGNARLLVVGEQASRGAPMPPIGKSPLNEDIAPVSPVEMAVTDTSRTRARTELRFDVVRHGVLVFDTGAGVNLVWPPVPFARIRAHLRLGLGSGYVVRATEVLFVELGGRGAGTNTDLLLERFVGSTLRLRWEGHGLYAQHTRGIESSSLLGAEWKVHPRTGLYAGVGCGAFGTPEFGLDVCRIWNGVRQDLWAGWIFAELEPELAWPRLPGQPRHQVPAVTVRLEVMLDARRGVAGAAP
jgi:hypothetical protein